MSTLVGLRTRDDHSQARSGGALLRKGFRPFFLLAAVFAAGKVLAWLLVLNGLLPLGGAAGPYFWHAHEMIFGFATAVVAGFLLTAASNWTKRETAVGRSLLALVGLWALGRVAMAAAAFLPGALVAAVDLAFLPAVGVAVGVPIVKSGSRRNYVLLVVLLALWIGNVSMHAAAAGLVSIPWTTGAYLAVNVLTLLMLLIGGRVIPMFTRNATGRDGIRSVPALDRLAGLSMAALTLAEALRPGSAAVGWLALVTASVALARTARWGTLAALSNPLLWILHVGHGFIVLGLLLKGLAALFGSVPPAISLHALSVGAIGGLTLGMMARVSLGHTGRMIVIDPVTRVAFHAIVLAAVARVAGPLLWPMQGLIFWVASGLLFSLAFGLYLFVFSPMLLRPRVDAKEG